MTKITFRHWKTGKPIQEVGHVVYDHPKSDRLILKKPDGKYEDIIKSTIIVKEDV